MTLVLTIFGATFSYLCGAVTAVISFNLNFYTYVNLSMIETFDLTICALKALVYGIVIPLISCQAGLEVFGGSEGVGRATTQAVVRTSLAIIALDFTISGLGYLVLMFF